MYKTNEYAHIYGFEDYKLVKGDLFGNPYFDVQHYFDDGHHTFIINKNLPVEMSAASGNVKFYPELLQDHKSLLNTAKKIYIHPECNLSRSMVAEKYKKSLNPFLSDAVVLPKVNYDTLSLNKYALFMNDKTKIIVMIRLYDDSTIQRIKGTPLGHKFASVISSNLTIEDSHKHYNPEAVLDAEFLYFGEILRVHNYQKCIIDALTNRLPLDKIVFEDSLQESLNCENNQIDFETLCSIHDMIESSDANTVATGLKALSMLDWMHYSQSVKYILDYSKVNWRYNKACNSTSVKYMIKTLSGRYAKRRFWWPGSFDKEIYENDYELFKKIVCHYDKVNPEDITSHIKNYPFMAIHADGYYPILKQGS